MTDDPYTGSHYDVIVAGAGFAGLTAATGLMNAGRSVCVMEARERPGGRIKAGEIAGQTIDLGGMWLGTTQKRLEQMAEKFQVRSYEMPLAGKNIVRLAGKTHHGQRENFDGLFGPLQAMDYLQVRRKLDRIVKTIDPSAPWNAQNADRLDGMTVQIWAERHSRTAIVRGLFRFICGSVLCAEPGQISMLFFAHYCASAGGLDALLSAESGGGQHKLFYGGLHQIAAKMADGLGDAIRYDLPVKHIRWSDDGVEITCGNEIISAEKLVMAIPPTLVTDVLFDPPLPSEKVALHAKLAMGSVIKIWAAYERPFWREQGFNGMVVRDDCPASPVFDVTPDGAEIGLIAGFFDGDHALATGDYSAEQRKSMVIDMLAEHFGEAARTPLDYVEQDWTAEQWSRGCYGAYAPPGVLSRYGKWLRQPVGPMHWAGTETAREWTGYVEGAIESGERAAEEILR